ncbi:hypothetical protein GGR52DRAFT_568182 [Hypoxylon sp. FL1284]|nr:hypothetical protein GGR52DRAFT_568182 [Hypoxylon sp. FL1284]
MFMPKRGTKRKVDLDVASDETDGLLVKKAKVKSTSASKSKNKRLSRLEEYDEDEGREGSRNFQRWAGIFEKSTKGEVAKSKAFMKNFGAKVKKQTDGMEKYMEEQEAKLTRAKDQDLSILKKLYSEAASAPVESSKAQDGDKPSHASKEGHALFEEAQAVILESYSLLNQFRDVDKKLKEYKLELPTARWKQDKEDIKDFLACGRKYGETLVESRLAPGNYPSPQNSKNDADEKEQVTAELFKDSCKASGEEDWGAVAADQVKKLTAMAKTVSVNEKDGVDGQ